MRSLSYASCLHGVEGATECRCSSVGLGLSEGWVGVLQDPNERACDRCSTPIFLARVPERVPGGVRVLKGPKERARRVPVGALGVALGCRWVV